MLADFYVTSHGDVYHTRIRGVCDVLYHLTLNIYYPRQVDAPPGMPTVDYILIVYHIYIGWVDVGWRRRR